MADMHAAFFESLPLPYSHHSRHGVLRLTYQILQPIVVLIDDDKNPARLIRTNKRVAIVLHGEDSSIRREGFLRFFDRPAWLDGENFKAVVKREYQKRSRYPGI